MQQKESDWLKFGYTKEFLDSMRSQDFWDAQYAQGAGVQREDSRLAATAAEGATAMFQFTLNGKDVAVTRTRICWSICAKTRG